ncbi:MAG: carbamate kinase [Spirochaetales bacterium]|nr:carbamate kinase [Spirochaetales bacterium]
MRKAVVEKKKSKDLAVVALGGNAIIRKGEKGDIHQQFANTRESMKPIVKFLSEGYNFILTHGNGPQVGNLMMMATAAKGNVPDVPLGVADAMTEGSLGYMIEQCLQNIMIKNGIWRNIVTIPTQVLVDKNDPSLKYPTKPIGPFFTEEEAKKIQKDTNWIMKEDSGRGFRRFVASPYPIDIVEKDAIKLLLENNYVVISGGGGGIPVFYEKDKTIEGIDCVIDKDLASMKIALATGAKTFIIITSVAEVCINFGKKNEEKIKRMTLAEAKYYYNDGQFGEGSMAPKIMAAIEFIQADPHHKVIITDVVNLEAAMEGEAGTTIVAY